VRSITWGKYVISYRTIFCSFWFGKYFNLCGLVHYAIDSLRMCVVFLLIIKRTTYDVRFSAVCLKKQNCCCTEMATQEVRL
jgi:hypothetical protein